MAEGRQPYHSGDVAFYESLRQPVLTRLRQELEGAPDTCSVCAQLCECAAEFDPEVRIRYRFGLNIDEILALDCAAHRPFFEGFREAMVEHSRRFYRGVDDAEARRQAAEARWPRIPLGVELRELVLHVGWGNLFQRVPMVMTRRDDVPGHPGAWARVRSPRVDLECIQSWRRRCATLHGDECANPWKVRPVKPLWLIDAERRCLVPGGEADAYVCLSYRRAKAAGFQTTQAALPDLQRPGCLDEPAIGERLPRVVTDALQLVRDLGERYLWVDALCIAHDDAAAEAEEIARMGRLYGSATLTLVAADDGDDDVGLPGAADPAPARLASQTLVPLGGERLLAFPPRPGLDPTAGTSYDGCAWTCQEYALAGRRLVFAGHRVHWLCPRERGDEWQRPRRLCCNAQCRQHNPAPRRPRPPSLTVHGLPDLGSYEGLVERYSGRALADPADAPRAIAGLLAVLGRGFPGGFHWGLPVMFLDAALCWRPAPSRRADSCHLRRRALPDPRPGDPVVLLPSWSWLGWQGPVQCCYDEDGILSPSSDTAYQTHPITTWYAVGSPSDSQDSPLSSWFRNRPAHCDPGGPLPPGWQRRHLDTPAEAPSLGFDRPPAGCGRYVFAHERLPYRYFWYHFPLAGDRPAEEETPTPTIPQPPYLRAATTRLCLEAYRDPALALGPGRPRPTVGLREPGRQRRVGHLWLHSIDDFARFPAEDGGGAPVELVAVCRRESTQVPKAYEVVEFYREHYAVLWVEWKDGVADRQASGVVDRGAWDAHPGREEVDLILG